MVFASAAVLEPDIFPHLSIVQSQTKLLYTCLENGMRKYYICLLRRIWTNVSVFRFVSLLGPRYPLDMFLISSKVY